MSETEPSTRKTADVAWEHPIFEQPVLPDHLGNVAANAKNTPRSLTRTPVVEENIILGEN